MNLIKRKTCVCHMIVFLVFFQIRDKSTHFSLYIYAREICFIACFRNIKKQRTEFQYVACFDLYFETFRLLSRCVAHHMQHHKQPVAG